VALLVFYLLVAGMYTEGGQGGNWGMQAAVKIRERVKLRQNDWQDILGQLVLALSDHPLVALTLIISASVVLLAVDSAGRRLLAADARAVLQRDKRPHVLY